MLKAIRTLALAGRGGLAWWTVGVGKWLREIKRRVVGRKSESACVHVPYKLFQFDYERPLFR